MVWVGVVVVGAGALTVRIALAVVHPVAVLLALAGEGGAGEEVWVRADLAERVGPESLRGGGAADLGGPGVLGQGAFAKPCSLVETTMFPSRVGTTVPTNESKALHCSVPFRVSNSRTSPASLVFTTSVHRSS